jgi:signal transduction histidine kinase
MTSTAGTTITLSQALEALNRLRSAAPSATAAKLGQIARLLQTLADENAYLNTLVLDSMPVGPPEKSTVQPEEAVPAASSSFVPPGEAVPGWFTGLSEALRPPLVAIRGRAELVQDGLLGQITPEQDQWLEAIEENTNRAFAVMDAVQELIALEQGKARIEKVNFISTDLTKEAWQRIRDKARAFDHDVINEAPEAVPLAYGDFYQSLIILTDLLDNALHYTSPHGQIRMSVDDLGTHVLFTVADSGIGLMPEELEFVGQPFWRGSHRMIRQHNGSGLRLYLAKKVLELLDGELIFSGEPGVGSTFSFTLPTPE